MKYEWRKQEKDFYSTKKQALIQTIPQQRFISMHGLGDPNGLEFNQKIQTLYPAAYGIKSAYKKYCADKVVNYDDYVVFPLEGVWSLTKRGQQLDHLDKSEFSYDIMIRVPTFVPNDLILNTLKNVQDKKNLPDISDIEIKEYPAKEVAQILHVGKYDDEPASFQKIDELVAEIQKKRTSKIHREIYLSDARRVAPEKLKTILRYEIE
ncbi:GyrI-like domain-containing protein [Companilactobacillus huachuanensis]|uniref:GyrI-like domain-containing protein n=1 Tax=Companilactobacillus huachuanensis TaxID=2559914 RepID=A0ABW1RLM4_9LACO|nr:GyrI-like domain-containing protein [Companilactobacillus huachuanensis]